MTLGKRKRPTRAFTPAPKPSQKKAVAKTIARPAAKKAAATKRAPRSLHDPKEARKFLAVRPGKPTRNLDCKTCKTKRVFVGSTQHRLQRKRAGDVASRKLVHVGVRCESGHEWNSRHPQAIAASRIADKEKVSIVEVIDGRIITPIGGFRAQRSREKAQGKQGAPLRELAPNNRPMIAPPHLHSNKEADLDTDEDTDPETGFDRSDRVEADGDEYLADLDDDDDPGVPDMSKESYAAGDHTHGRIGETRNE